MGGCGGSTARPGIAGPGPPQLRASESKGGFLPSEEEGPSACFLLRSKIDALGLPVFHYFQSLVIKSEFINLLVLLKVNYTNLKKKKKQTRARACSRSHADECPVGALIQVKGRGVAGHQPPLGAASPAGVANDLSTFPFRGPFSRSLKLHLPQTGRLRLPSPRDLSDFQKNRGKNHQPLIT